MTDSDSVEKTGAYEAKQEQWERGNLTWGDIMKAFNEQFPGLEVSDMRPNAPNQLYIWISNSPTNILATYRPGEKTFIVETTYNKWSLLG